MPRPTTNHVQKNIAKDEPVKETRNTFQSKKKKDNGIDDSEYKGLGDIRPKKSYDNENDDDIECKGLRDRRTLFEPEEHYYGPVRISNAFDDDFIQYENNGDKDKTLSIKEYLDKIIPYLSDMINDLKTQDEWKIQLTIAINFFILKILTELVPCI